ncbi:MAG: hypothetical protein H0V82_05675 [Candidatus Protochlamydia sp.]|nr:hypothetical protein [Candidatus Protochlamydia sp.]
MKLKRTYFTLLETLIAVTIVSVLLTIVFGFFRELSESSRMTEEMQHQSFRMRYVEMRLAYLFERIVNENDENKREFFFFTEKGEKGVLNGTSSLIFSFNNEARASPAFSGDLLAKLYIDPSHRLCLAMWPIYSDQPHEEMQKEVLMDDVSDIAYEFFMPPARLSGERDIGGGKNDPEKKSPENDRWHQQEWLRSYEQIPAIARIKLKIASNPKELQTGTFNPQAPAKELNFAFVLPSSKNYLYYPPDS